MPDKCHANLVQYVNADIEWQKLPALPSLAIWNVRLQLGMGFAGILQLCHLSSVEFTGSTFQCKDSIEAEALAALTNKFAIFKTCWTLALGLACVLQFAFSCGHWPAYVINYQAPKRAQSYRFVCTMNSCSADHTPFVLHTKTSHTRFHHARLLTDTGT